MDIASQVQPFVIELTLDNEHTMQGRLKHSLGSMSFLVMCETEELFSANLSIYTTTVSDWVSYELCVGP